MSIRVYPVLCVYTVLRVLDVDLCQREITLCYIGKCHLRDWIALREEAGIWIGKIWKIDR